MKKVIWYVLHNSPEIDMYLAEFERRYPDKDMKQEFSSWFESRNNITQILASSESFKDQQYILATQVKQVFYLEDMARRPLHWKLVQDVNHKTYSDDEFLTNDDDDEVATMQATVACGYGGDSGCDDPSRPLSRQIGIGCRGVGGQKATKKGMGGGRDRGT
ncbi:hypothetical protein Tco_0637718 [Tanacetum coccineum]